MIPVVYVVGRYREGVMKNWAVGVVVRLNSVPVVVAALGLYPLFVCFCLCVCGWLRWMCPPWG